MPAEPELFYLARPDRPRPPGRPVAFLPVQEFLADEPACRALWDLVAAQFRTRGKFLAVWPGVRYVAACPGPDGAPDGFLLVTARVGWQVDYVVVRPEARGRGAAAALLAAALDQAYRRGVPWVTLTSRPALRPLYEGCGFAVVAGPPPGDQVPAVREAGGPFAGPDGPTAPRADRP